MPHGQMAFQLTHRIQYHADHNQQTGSAEELGDHKRDTEVAIEEHREYRKHEQEKRAACGYSGHGRIKEICSRLPRTDARNIRAFFFQIVRDLQRIELIRNPEETEKYLKKFNNILSKGSW